MSAIRMAIARALWWLVKPAYDEHWADIAEQCEETLERTEELLNRWPDPARVEEAVDKIIADARRVAGPPRGSG